MPHDKKADVTIYTETPATGVKNGIDIIPSLKQKENVEAEASKNLLKEKEKAKKDQIEKTDNSGEAG